MEQILAKTSSAFSQQRPLLGITKDNKELPINDNFLLPKMVSGGFKNLLGIEDSQIPMAVRILLSWGPRFVPPHSTTVIDYADVLQFLFKAMMRKTEAVHPESCFRELVSNHYFDLEEFYTTKDSITHKERMLKHLFQTTKQFLDKNPRYSVVQADKGRVTALMETALYRTKMDAWVSKCVAAGMYRLVEDFNANRVLIRNIYKQLCHKLRTFYLERIENGEHPYPRKLYNLLAEYNEDNRRLPYLYGVVKCHKEELPCRPICGTLHWYTYPIQKIISHVLSEVLSEKLCSQNVKDITKVAQELYTVPLCEGYEFVKFDIVDMYPRMDTDRIITLVKDITDSEWYKEKNTIPSALVLTSLRFTIEKASFFSYDGHIYKQEKGLPQGACDSAFLATLLLDYLLQLHYGSIFDEHMVIYWWKYMDDFLVYMPTEKIESFQRTFEEATSMQLTVEREEKNIDGLPNINFLDIMIVRGLRGIEISLYSKPMASLRMIHYHSHHLQSYKEQTVRNFIQRTLDRTSNCKLVDDLAFYECKFYNNCYPSLFVGEQFYNIISREIQNIDDGQPSLKLPMDKLLDRKRILQKFLERFEHVDAPILFTTRQTTFNPSQVQSINYCSEEFSSFIRRAFRLFNLGSPVFKTADSCFRELRMSLVDPDPSLPGVSAQLSTSEGSKVYLVSCEGCDTTFLLSGIGPRDDLLEDAKQNQRTPIRKHMDNYSHLISSQITTLPVMENMSVELRIKLYKSLYTVLDIPCEDTHSLSYIPLCVKRATDICIRKIMAEGSISNKKLGIPFLPQQRKK